MPITIESSFFQNRDEVLEDIRKHGNWPTTFVSGPSEGLPLHWHDDEVHGYVMEGRTSFVDGATGKETLVGPGDKVIVPARCVHAEGAVADRVVYIIALPEPRTPDEFLVQRAPGELGE
jgi:quercetin dioxygenase-like cupin family protein